MNSLLCKALSNIRQYLCIKKQCEQNEESFQCFATSVDDYYLKTFLKGLMTTNGILAEVVLQHAD